MLSVSCSALSRRNDVTLNQQPYIRKDSFVSHYLQVEVAVTDGIRRDLGEPLYVSQILYSFFGLDGSVSYQCWEEELQCQDAIKKLCSIDPMIFEVPVKSDGGGSSRNR